MRDVFGVCLWEVGLLGRAFPHTLLFKFCFIFDVRASR